MKTFKRLLVFYTTIMVISVTLHSCCTDKYKITGEGEISAYFYDSLYTQVIIDTIKSDPFQIEQCTVPAIEFHSDYFSMISADALN